MPCHLFGFGGLDEHTRLKYLAILTNMHNDIQRFANKMSYIARIRTCRAIVFRYLHKQAELPAQEIQDNKHSMTNDEFLDYIQTKVDSTVVAEISQLKVIVMHCLDMVNWKGCYVKLRQVCCDYDEWNLLKDLFSHVSRGDIKGCKVTEYNIIDVFVHIPCYRPAES